MPRRTPWPAAPAPKAPRISHVIHQLGRVRNDPYAWMKHIPSAGSRTLANLPAPLRDHLMAEMHYAQALLTPLQADADALCAKMQARAVEVHALTPVTHDGWSYSATRTPGHPHRVFSRSTSDGNRQVLVDESLRAHECPYYRATDHQHSPNDRWFAWAEDCVGDDRHQICLLDMQGGGTRVVVDANAFGYGGLVFSPSSRYLFWIWRDEHSRPTRLNRIEVENGMSQLVYEKHDPAIFMRVSRTAANGFVALTLFGPDVSEVRLISTDAETQNPRTVCARHQ